jgi:hypothetical protein
MHLGRSFPQTTLSFKDEQSPEFFKAQLNVLKVSIDDGGIPTSKLFCKFLTLNLNSYKEVKE